MVNVGGCKKSACTGRRKARIGSWLQHNELVADFVLTA
jgi:hypothetical protein